MKPARRGGNISILTIIWIGVALTVSVPVSGQEIWFGMRGLEPNWHGVRGFEDWQRLFFSENPQWPHSMDGVRVIQIVGNTIEQMEPVQLARVVAELKRRDIRLAISVLAQPFAEACGVGVEGYANPPKNHRIAEKIKQAGGVVDYVTMDEPLWFGHYYNGKNACHSAIPEIAKGVASNIAMFKEEFPEVEIGEDEPLLAISAQPDWEHDYREWLGAFRSATESRLAYMHVDINWGVRGWQRQLPVSIDAVRALKLPIGIIFNAGPNVADDAQWLQQAEEHITVVEGEDRVEPNHAIFESWAWFPTHTITDETGPGYDRVIEEYYEKRIPLTRERAIMER